MLGKYTHESDIYSLFYTHRKWDIKMGIVGSTSIPLLLLVIIKLLTLSPYFWSLHSGENEKDEKWISIMWRDVLSEEFIKGKDEKLNYVDIQMTQSKNIYI